MAITKEEIVAKCSADLIASRQLEQIATVVSEGRTRPSGAVVGNGTIITALQDLTVANALLEVLHTDARFKYVVPLLDQGRLVIGDPLVSAMVQSFVPAILTQAQADRLISLGVEPDQVDAYTVSTVLYNPDGSLK